MDQQQYRPGAGRPEGDVMVVDRDVLQFEVVHPHPTFVRCPSPRWPLRLVVRLMVWLLLGDFAVSFGSSRSFMGLI